MFDVFTAIVSLAEALKRAILLAEDLRFISKKCEEVLHRLRLLEKLLRDVDDEFHRTIELARKAGASSTRLQPSRNRLESGIASCQTACKAYEELLREVKTSYFQQWKWTKAEKQLPRLHRNLEASKADLLIAMNLVRYVML
jgi:DNA repair ATPase RecN